MGHLVPIAKNLLRRQNPLELVFQDILTFDAQRPIVGSLLLDVEKKNIESELVKKAPSLPGIGYPIQNRLNKLKTNNENFNENDGADNNDG